MKVSMKSGVVHAFSKGIPAMRQHMMKAPTPIPIPPPTMRLFSFRITPCIEVAKPMTNRPKTIISAQQSSPLAIMK